MLLIRHETPADWHAVEALTRRAFWNVHTPGCRDHYLVHCLRSHVNFIPELGFVLEQDPLFCRPGISRYTDLHAKDPMAQRHPD